MNKELATPQLPLSGHVVFLDLPLSEEERYVLKDRVQKLGAVSEIRTFKPRPYVM